MNAVLTAVLSLIGELAPAAGSLGVTGKIIETISTILPVAIKEYQDVVPFIKNIIDALKNDPDTTQAQLDQLDALNKQVDDAFDAAAGRAEAEDKA